MLIVGLTGNYGMGKSTVLHMFKEVGAITIDADEVVKSLLKEKDVLEKIREILGERVFNRNGTLNKEKVVHLIFGNNTLRHSLEDIIHPLVFEKIRDLLDKMNSKDKVVIVEVPVLYERGYEDRFDSTITVFTKDEVALNRLENNGVNREDALLRLKAQLPILEKIKRADYIIDNNGSIESTMGQVEIIYNKLLHEGKDGDYQRP